MGVTPGSFTESVVEDGSLAWLETLDYTVLRGPGIVAGEAGAERSDPSYCDVLLEWRLRQALMRLTLDLSPGAVHEQHRAGGVRRRSGAEGRVMTEEPGGEVIVYEATDGEVRVHVRLERETVWLTLAQMAELFGRERSVVIKHVRIAFQEGELDPAATRAIFAQVRAEGGRTVTREVGHFGLDVIILVGYRIKSLRGTQFRVWVWDTRPLREHLVHGYTLDPQLNRRAVRRKSRVAW